MTQGQNLTADKSALRPNAGALASWLLSWVQPSGAVHGFHNHSVWGSNPYRWSDFTSGHSTWASPLAAALAMAVNERRDAVLEDVIVRMMRLQTEAFQEDGQYAHIGFQVGESLKRGLIHNMMPNVAIGLVAQLARDWLPADVTERIRLSVLKSMEANDRIYPFGIVYTGGRAISNQEYARLWGKLVFQQTFGDTRWDAELREQLDFMTAQYHFRGLPDMDSEASYRYLGDKTSTEPAEYYGLLVAPLVLAYEMFGDEKYLEHAHALCRHLSRSAWYDANGQIRLHRVWYHSGSRWVKLNKPMLIAGMGMSLYGVHRVLEHRADAELEAFLRKCDAAYAYYQNPRGYFASASGWQNEADIAPCTAWHAHDLFYLLARHGAGEPFRTDVHRSDERVSVLLGDQCMWVESGVHWTITDYHGIDVYRLIGRKDEPIFGRDMDWIGGERTLPAHFSFPDRPMFMKTDEGIFLMPGKYREADLRISSIASLPYLGIWS